MDEVRLTAAGKRADERMRWVLNEIVRRKFGGIVAWDADVVDDFVEAFPEAEKTLVIYSQGPNSCPMLNRAATRARDRGYLIPGHVGNQDARSFNLRTWCRYWSITPAGRAHLASNGKKGE
jgi:hypothetical protein